MSSAAAIKSVNWQDPSKFQIAITGDGADEINMPDADVLSMACLTIQVVDINTTPIEQYIGEEWRLSSGRLENYQLSISFKDYNNFELYKIFAKGIQDLNREYPDDQAMNITIRTSDDFKEDEFEDIVIFKNSILTTVSGPTLDHSAVASVAEFTVTFKCSYVST